MRLALAALAVAAGPTPAQLLHRIAVSPWPTAQLPAGVTISQAGALPLSAQGKKWHAVGEVGFILKGPDAFDEIVYEVFPNAADARGDLTHPHLNPGDRKGGSVAGVPNSLTITTTATQNGKKTGVTVLAAARGNVIVQAITTSGTSTAEGDTALATKLLKAGIAHLSKLSGLSA